MMPAPTPTTGASDGPQRDCAEAIRMQMAGRPDLAEPLYRSVLDREPDNDLANHCLGMLQVQLQRPALGLPFLLSALNARPERADYWLGYLEALLLTDGGVAAGEALALGRRHGLKGASVEDVARRIKAATQPKRVPASERRRDKSRQILAQADEELWSLVGHGRFAEARERARTLIADHPDYGLGWKIFGAMLWVEGHCEEALEAMRESVRLLPLDAETLSNYGSALAKMQRGEEAERWIEKAIAADPAFAGSYYRLGMTYELQGRYIEAEAALRTAISLRQSEPSVDDQQGFSNFLYLLGYNADIDPQSLLDEHRRYAELFEAPLRAGWPRHSNSRDPDRVLRIGFVSGDLHDHSVATFLDPVLMHLSQCHSLQLHAYSNHTVVDRVSQRLQGFVHTWNSVTALSDIELAAKVAQDGIDILIDLSGHTARNRLRALARKPAPVQASWLGYPCTTGLKAVDYYLADPSWLPPGRFDHLFTEKLIYLPDRWAFVPHSQAPPVGPLPALAHGRLTFGSFHRIGKLNPSTIELWSQLLKALPQARLLVAGIPLDGTEKRVINRFAAHGIGTDRLDFHARCTMDLYLGLHNRVDIALDTHPYCGATTSMHSLSMGVPVLTLAGRTSTARACAGILGHVGLEDFVAADPADFVAKGVGWSSRLAELAALRAELRTRLTASPGGQPGLIAAHFEAALRHVWRRWCAELPPESFHTTLEP